MSEESPAESNDKSKKRTRRIKVDRKFLIVAAVFIISVVTLSYAAISIFDKSIDDWNIMAGRFDTSKGKLASQVYNNSIAHHTSTVAYGTWEWQVRYAGTGSASINFIGRNPDTTRYNLSTEGYKLEFVLDSNLALQRIISSTTAVTLNSSVMIFEKGIEYDVKITRLSNNTFYVYVDDILKITATDGTCTTSEIFQLNWYGLQQLYWVKVTDSVGEGSWDNYFSGRPNSHSPNTFTQISLYLPFVTLGLVILFYVFRLLFSEGSWKQFLVPLILAMIIGVGYGFIAEYFLSTLPGLEDDTDVDDVPTTTPTNTTTTGNESDPNFGTEPTPTNDPDNEFSPDNSNSFTGINKDTISMILLIGAGGFILVAMVFVAIDFFKKRADEFHERTIDREKRWFPAATSTDHRKRVIRAYHKASYDLIDSGAKSEKSMTPGEFSDSVNTKFELPDKSLNPLTDLYEEARFSEHEMTSDSSELAENLSDKISTTVKPERSSKTDSTIEEVTETEEIDETEGDEEQDE